MRHALRSVVSAFLFFTLFLGTTNLLVGCNKRDSQAAATKWTCPMHPEVVSTQEGVCPKCNMKLVPAKDEPKPQPQNDSQAAATKWTCPMHPEVVSTQEGLCPKCNMKLVPAKDEPKPQPRQPDGGSQAAGKWTCPMHPEVVSTQEGLCPKCNMKLVPAARDEAKPQPSKRPGSSKTP